MKTPWYIAGLYFECSQCGNCCSGPDEGYVWAVKKEQGLIAKYLSMPLEKLRKKYLRRIGNRTSLIEKPATKDCVFLTNLNGQKVCGLYHVRPNQCRTWPFWSSNLSDPDQWNEAAMKCPGINRGKLYTFDEIEKLRNQKKWWPDEPE